MRGERLYRERGKWIRAVREGGRESGERVAWTFIEIKQMKVQFLGLEGVNIKEKIQLQPSTLGPLVEKLLHLEGAFVTIYISYIGSVMEWSWVICGFNEPKEWLGLAILDENPWCYAQYQRRPWPIPRGCMVIVCYGV